MGANNNNNYLWGVHGARWNNIIRILFCAMDEHYVCDNKCVRSLIFPCTPAVASTCSESLSVAVEIDSELLVD